MFLRNSRAPRLLAGAAALALTIPLAAAPAWADCAADLQAFDDDRVAAQTGASSDESSAAGTGAAGTGMPATEHQEEVLSGAEEPPMETAAGASGEVESTTPHQRDVVRGLEAEGLDSETSNQVALLVTEARAALQEGDEQGCQTRLDEARDLMAE